jgi:hypothetical protein
MLDIDDDSLAFIRDRLVESAGEVRATIRDDDPAARAARAKVLDSAAGVLSALQTLLRAAEEMVLQRRDRLMAGGTGEPETRRRSKQDDVPDPDAAEAIPLTY